MSNLQVKYQPPARPTAAASGLATAQYPVPLPYPEVAVAGPNLWYARLLHDVAFGAESELTAIHEYSYWAVMTDIEQLRGLFESFARDEMRHMEMFMKAIRKLCGDPRYVDGRGVPWCSTNVYYGYRDCDRLAKAYEDELAAAADYRRLAGVIGDPHLQALLERIAKDEDQHARLSAEWMRQTCGYYPGNFRPGTGQ